MTERGREEEARSVDDRPPVAVRPHRASGEGDFDDPSDEAPEVRAIAQPPEITEMPQPVSTPSSAIPISGYHAPISIKAAAAFASGTTGIPGYQQSAVSAWSFQAKLIVLLLCALFLLLFLAFGILLWAKTHLAPGDISGPAPSTLGHSETE